MNAKLAPLAVLAAAVMLTSVAAASPDAVKQRFGAESALGAARGVRCATVTPYARGTLWRTVDGVCFSFKVPRAHPPSSWPWESGPIVGGRSRALLISKSTVGGQRAEAVVFWTGVEGGRASLCASLPLPARGRSAGDLAATMAEAPGTQVVKRPRRVTVGGRPAWHLVLSVRRDRGCDPGYFFSWQPSPDGECWGACWLDTNVGDAISLWIVDVHGKRLVIEAETRQPESRGYPLAMQVTRADALEVEAEIETIVESIRFG